MLSTTENLNYALLSFILVILTKAGLKRLSYTYCYPQERSVFRKIKFPSFVSSLPLTFMILMLSESFTFSTFCKFSNVNIFIIIWWLQSTSFPTISENTIHVKTFVKWLFNRFSVSLSCLQYLTVIFLWNHCYLQFLCSVNACAHLLVSRNFFYILNPKNILFSSVSS